MTLQFLLSPDAKTQLPNDSPKLHLFFFDTSLNGNCVLTFTKQKPYFSPNAVPPPVHFQHTIIPWRSYVRYLGVTLDSKLLYTQHITSVTHPASGTLLRLFPLLAHNSTLSLSNKLILYKLIICSILVYAAPVWSNTSLHNYRRLQVSQSKCLRVIGNYPVAPSFPCFILILTSSRSVILSFISPISSSTDAFVVPLSMGGRVWT